MRKPNWLALLREQIAAADGRAFEYGVHDCCMWAARVADAISDSHYVTTLQGMYTDEASGLALLEQPGGLRALTVSIAGPEKAVARASRGDLLLIGTGDSESLAICNGPQLVAVSLVGVTTRSLALAICAWTV